MKRLNTLIYIGFALVVWGSFSNFAQNDYGYFIIQWAQFAIGIILFIEAVLSLSEISVIGKTRAFYLFSEHFLIACFFLAGFLKYMHWPGAGPLYVLSCALLALLYIIVAFVRLGKDLRHGWALALIVFLVYISAAIAVGALVFKIMHWPGSFMLGLICLVICPLILLAALIKRNFRYKEGSMSLFMRLRALTGRPGLVFGYFSTWVIYISLIGLGVAPDFYTYAMSRPPAAEQLRQQGREDRANTYIEHYEEFFENRWKEENR
jgi:hypothetical protein